MRQSIVGLALGAVVMAGVSGTSAPKAEKPGWHALFDGATLTGWKAAEHPDAWTVKDGTLACNGERSHLFYVGPVAQAQFADFEAEFEVRTHTGANSGVFFHTAWQDSGWPVQGFEMQVNNHQPHFPGDSGAAYIENKKTGSLYGIRNAYKALARDNEWFTLKLRVQGPRVRIHVNDTLVVDYLEPEGTVAGLTPPLQKIGKGTFALQCHDAPEPGAVSAHRGASAAAGAGGADDARAEPGSGVRQALSPGARQLPAGRPARARREGVRPARGGAGRGPRRRPVRRRHRVGRQDPRHQGRCQRRRLVRRFAGKPLFLGLRADDRGWATAITPKALAKVDFVLLDGETLAAAVPGTGGRSAGLRRRAGRGDGGGARGRAGRRLRRAVLPAGGARGAA